MWHKSCTAVLTLLLGIFITSASHAAMLDKVLVVVNDEAITSTEYLIRSRQYALETGEDVNQSVPSDGQYDRRIIELLITETLQTQRAELQGIKISTQEIDDAINFIAEQNGVDQNALYTQLAGEGISTQQFRKNISAQQMIRRLVDKEINARIAVSESEIEEYLSTHKELANEDEIFELSHLFLGLPENADPEITQTQQKEITRIRQEIIDGLPFDAAVNKYSDGNKENSGHIGKRKPGQLPEIFIDPVRAAKSGSITDIITSPNGFHLLFVHHKSGQGEMVRQQRIRHVLIATNPELDETELQEKASTVRQRLMDGESFDSVARLYSDDAQSSQNAGNIGWISPGAVVPKFENAALQLAIGEISQPVRSQYGYHIIQVLDRRENDVSSERASFNARQIIHQRKAAEQYQLWVGALRDNAYIEYIVSSNG